MRAPILPNHGLRDNGVRNHDRRGKMGLIIYKGKAHTYRLQRPVGNLIDNAIKFTPAGGHVDVTLECKGTTFTVTLLR